MYVAIEEYINRDADKPRTYLGPQLLLAVYEFVTQHTAPHLLHRKFPFILLHEGVGVRSRETCCGGREGVATASGCERTCTSCSTRTCVRMGVAHSDLVTFSHEGLDELLQGEVGGSGYDFLTTVGAFVPVCAYVCARLFTV